MEKPRKLTKEELQNRKGKGRGIQKHIIVKPEIDQLISEYSKRLGCSEAKVIEELLLVGVRGFEQNHNFGVTEKNSNERTESLTEQLNRKAMLIMEKRKLESAKKNSDMADSYSRQLAHNYDDYGWQSF